MLIDFIRNEQQDSVLMREAYQRGDATKVDEKKREHANDPHVLQWIEQARTYYSTVNHQHNHDDSSDSESVHISRTVRRHLQMPEASTSKTRSSRISSDSESERCSSDESTDGEWVESPDKARKKKGKSKRTRDKKTATPVKNSIESLLKSPLQPKQKRRK